MWEINKKIRPVRDARSIYEVDCIARPHGIILESLTPGIYETFLFYLACAKSYSFIHNLEPYIWPIGVYEYVVKMLGFRYEYIECNDTKELHEKLVELTKRECAVLVPANIRELFYSWSYPDTDALHLFLVTGYNQATNIYTIIDNLQNLNYVIPTDTNISGNFTDFHIKEEDLNKCYKALENLPVPLYSKRIVTISSPDSINIPTSLQKLGFLAAYAEKTFDPRCYREIEVFQSTLEAFEKMNYPRDGRERLFRFQMVFANKTFLFRQILESLKKIGANIDYQKCSLIMKDIISDWDKYKNIFYLHFIRNQVNSIYELRHIYEPIIKKEEVLLKLLKEIVEKKERRLCNS